MATSQAPISVPFNSGQTLFFNVYVNPTNMSTNEINVFLDAVSNKLTEELSNTYGSFTYDGTTYYYGYNYKFEGSTLVKTTPFVTVTLSIANFNNGSPYYTDATGNYIKVALYYKGVISRSPTLDQNLQMFIQKYNAVSPQPAQTYSPISNVIFIETTPSNGNSTDGFDNTSLTGGPTYNMSALYPFSIYLLNDFQTQASNMVPLSTSDIPCTDFTVTAIYQYFITSWWENLLLAMFWWIIPIGNFFATYGPALGIIAAAIAILILIIIIRAALGK